MAMITKSKEEVAPPVAARVYSVS